MIDDPLGKVFQKAVEKRRPLYEYADIINHIIGRMVTKAFLPLRVKIDIADDPDTASYGLEVLDTIESPEEPFWYEVIRINTRIYDDSILITRYMEYPRDDFEDYLIPSNRVLNVTQRLGNIIRLSNNRTAWNEGIKIYMNPPAKQR